MFNACDFTFDGESASIYGLKLYDIGGRGQDETPFGNLGEIVETRTSTKVSPIHFGVNYNSTPLEFKLVFGAETALDRYDLQAVSLWLTGHQQYKWLSIDQPDLENVQFNCIITQLTPITYGWLPVAFEATVACDIPYAYGYPFEKQYNIFGETEILFVNDSSVREFVKPELKIVPAVGTSSFSIKNASDKDREFLFESLPNNMVISVDNMNGIIQDNTYGLNLYDKFNLNFFRLVQGDNYLTVKGDAVLTISGRLLYNIGG